MSSVKRLKSKGRATTGTYDGTVAILVGFGDTHYDYRKAAFAGLPPATIVRPMRTVRARMAAANTAFDRAVQAGVKAGLDWAGISEATVAVRAQLDVALSVYRQARRAAKAGQGHIVHLAAA